MAGAPIGNENAKKGKEYRLALRRALARQSGTASEGLQQVATKLIEAALAGEPWAIKEVADRTDGRPAQALEHSGADGESIPLAMGLTFVSSDRA